MRAFDIYIMRRGSYFRGSTDAVVLETGKIMLESEAYVNDATLTACNDAYRHAMDPCSPVRVCGVCGEKRVWRQESGMLSGPRDYGEMFVEGFGAFAVTSYRTCRIPRVAWRPSEHELYFLGLCRRWMLSVHLIW